MSNNYNAKEISFLVEFRFLDNTIEKYRVKASSMYKAYEKGLIFAKKLQKGINEFSIAKEPI